MSEALPPAADDARLLLDLERLRALLAAAAAAAGSSTANPGAGAMGELGVEEVALALDPVTKLRGLSDDWPGPVPVTQQYNTWKHSTWGTHLSDIPGAFE